ASHVALAPPTARTYEAVPHPVVRSLAVDRPTLRRPSTGYPPPRGMALRAVVGRLALPRRNSMTAASTSGAGDRPRAALPGAPAPAGRAGLARSARRRGRGGPPRESRSRRRLGAAGDAPARGLRWARSRGHVRRVRRP